MAFNSPWSSKGTVFGAPNSDSKSTPGFGIFSNPTSASTTSSFPPPAFPTGFTTGTSNAFQSTGFGFNSTNAFGVPKNSPTGFTTGTSNAFQSTGFGINSTNAFGVPKNSPTFATGFTTGTSNAFQSTGFGINSTNAFGVTKNSPTFATGFTTGTSNAFPSTTSVFGVNSTNASGFRFGTNSSTESFPSTTSVFGVNSTNTSGFRFGTNSSTTPVFGVNSTNTSGFLFGTNSSTGSRKVPYKATPFKEDEKNLSMQSISGMSEFGAKSHEELRFEDYESKHIGKGDGCDTPEVNIFRNPNNNLFGPPCKSTSPSTISTPFSSPFPKTSPFNLPSLINKNTTTVPSPNPFSFPQTNPNPSQSPQTTPFNTQSLPAQNTTTVPSPNPFSFPKTNPNPFQPPPTSPFNTQTLPSFNNQNTTTVPSPNPFSFPQTNPNPSQLPQTSPFNLPSLINKNTTTVPSPNPFSFPQTNPNPSQSPQTTPFNTQSLPAQNTTTVPSPNPFSFPKTNSNHFQPPPTSPFNTQTFPSFINQNTTTVPSPNPFSFPQTNPNPSQSPQTSPFNLPSLINKNTTTVPSPNPFSFPKTNPNPSQSPQTSPHINEQQQQYVQANTVGVQSTLVADPFPTRSEIDRPNTVLTLVQHGISSLPSQVPNNLSANRSTSSLRIRHVSPRLNSLPPQNRYTSPSSSERKVAFFEDGVDRPGSFVPRENPRAWVTNSLPSPHSSLDGKCCKEKDLPSSSPELKTCIQEETEHLTAISISHQNDDDDSVIVAKKHEDDVLALMPKLPKGDEYYYTEPSLTELAAKEMDEPGSLSRVNDFVVGKSGCGSIKFFGETDVRHLDLGTIIQFKNREVIVYADEKTKPAVGEGMNKAAEVTLLNVKCVDKKTGKQYVDGPRVESYKEMLMKKGLEQGTEFVSYDPVRGEWRFRVLHF